MRLVLLSLLACAATAAAASDQGATPRSRGGAVYEADLALRAAFARAEPGALPESKAKRVLPKADDTAMDWSRLVKADHVRDQKGSTSSWAFAATSALAWSWAIRNGPDRAPDLAAGPILDRARLAGAGSVASAFDDLLRHGTCTAREFARQARPARPGAAMAMTHRAIAWGEVEPGRGVAPVASIKRTLVDHGPVVASVYLTRAFQSYRGGVFAEHARPPANAPPGGHFVVIVGWDDRRGREGCWKVENSWGKGWGEEGFLWIEYGSNEIGRDACWVRAQSDQYDLPEEIEHEVDAATAHFPRRAEGSRRGGRPGPSRRLGSFVDPTSPIPARILHESRRQPVA